MVFLIQLHQIVHDALVFVLVLAFDHGREQYPLVIVGSSFILLFDDSLIVQQEVESILISIVLKRIVETRVSKVVRLFARGIVGVSH